MDQAEPPTVLVVDDDRNVREATAAILRDAGYKVLDAAGAVGAIAHLSVEDVGVLLTDIRMPGLSGFVLAEQARQLQPGLAVIYTTGFIPQQEWDRRRDESMLCKPYRRHELLARLEQVIAERASLRPSS